jgi:hypothetical protein
VIDVFERIAKEEGINFEFHKANDIEVEIEETDVLFIDTLHCYTQLIQELRLHASKARNHIIMHDTETFGLVGGPHRVNGRLDKGLKYAIVEFLGENSDWKLDRHYTQCNGLTIMNRTIFTPNHSAILKRFQDDIEKFSLS